MLYTQYTINEMKSSLCCTCNLISPPSAISHIHTLLTPTHTTHPLPTNQICGHDMQFCVASFQHIMQYIQVAIHINWTINWSFRESQADSSFSVTCRATHMPGGRERHENGILYHVCEKAIGYYSCIIDITLKVPSQISFCSGGTGKVDKFP